VVPHVWDAEEEKWWFSIIDVVQALTGTVNPRRYWSDLKRKLQDEGSQLYDKIVQQKLMSSDGKNIKPMSLTKLSFCVLSSLSRQKGRTFR
jgi:hypothetical protein